MKKPKLNKNYLKYPTAEDMMSEAFSADKLDVLAAASLRSHFVYAKENVRQFKLIKNPDAWQKDDQQYQEVLLAAFSLICNYYGVDIHEYEREPAKKNAKPKTKNSKKS